MLFKLEVNREIVKNLREEFKFFLDNYVMHGLDHSNKVLGTRLNNLSVRITLEPSSVETKENEKLPLKYFILINKKVFKNSPVNTDDLINNLIHKIHNRKIKHSEIKTLHVRIGIC